MATPPGHTPENSERYLRDYNHRIVAASDEFYSYERPAGFSTRAPGSTGVQYARGSGPCGWKNKVRGTFAEFLRFTSPVRTPYRENNLAMRAGFRHREDARSSCCCTGTRML